MYVYPHITAELLAAIANLLPNVALEIQQRKHSGFDEGYADLEARYRRVRDALNLAEAGHGKLSAIQVEMLNAYPDDLSGLADWDDLATHGDGLLHFLLSEISDCGSREDAFSRLNLVSQQVSRCAAQFEKG